MGLQNDKCAVCLAKYMNITLLKTAGLIIFAILHIHSNVYV